MLRRNCIAGGTGCAREKYLIIMVQRLVPHLLHCIFWLHSDLLWNKTQQATILNRFTHFQRFLNEYLVYTVYTIYNLLLQTLVYTVVTPILLYKYIPKTSLSMLQPQWALHLSAIDKQSFKADLGSDQCLDQPLYTVKTNLVGACSIRQHIDSLFIWLMSGWESICSC